MTADTLDFGACLFRCVLMGLLREHSFELKGYLLRTNINPHFLFFARSAFCIIAIDCQHSRPRPSPSLDLKTNHELHASETENAVS